MHTTWSDGAYSVAEMGEALIERGYRYSVITDHSQYLKVANGLTPERLKKQRVEIDAFNEAHPVFHLYAGTEMDILPDGTLDFEDDLVLETYLDQHNTQTIYNKQDIKKSDLQKIDEFKKDIYSIERIALIPMRECLPYTNNLQKGLENLTQIKDDVVYAKEMCEDVVEIYDNMKVPTLSKDEYTQILDRAKVNVRKTYELRTLAMASSSNLIDTKNPIYINKITEYLKLSDKEITSFKNKINELKETIKEE